MFTPGGGQIAIDYSYPSVIFYHSRQYNLQDTICRDDIVLKRGRGACKIVCGKLCFKLPFYEKRKRKCTESSDLYGFSCALSELYGLMVGIVLVTTGQL